jgi:hypothetical protein
VQELLPERRNTPILTSPTHNSVPDLWDGCNLRYTFRRTVDIRLFNLWEEVLNFASSLVLSNEDDEPVWQFHSTGMYSSQSLYRIINFTLQFHSSGIYSSQSLYRIINFRGGTPVYIPAVWKLRVPPRIHFSFDCFPTISCSQEII